MPEGSSSEAPVTRPGPSTLRKRLSFANRDGATAGAAAAAFAGRGDRFRGRAVGFFLRGIPHAKQIGCRRVWLPITPLRLSRRRSGPLRRADEASRFVYGERPPVVDEASLLRLRQRLAKR